MPVRCPSKPFFTTTLFPYENYQKNPSQDCGIQCYCGHRPDCPQFCPGPDADESGRSCIPGKEWTDQTIHHGVDLQPHAHTGVGQTVQGSRTCCDGRHCPEALSDDQGTRSGCFPGGESWIKTGPVDPANHEECVGKLMESIELCVAAGYKRVITFTGMKAEGIEDEQAEENCISCWKKVLPFAEKNKVTLCLEHLNSRDDSHPMKGHPGYFGDDVDHCVKMIKRIGSEHFKLLFDVYHVQVMNGDVIRRIKQYQEVIGHYHTAGNPGRAELDENQEINYPGVMRAILNTGFEGYVAQEFIPTWKDKALALRHAAEICDV